MGKVFSLSTALDGIRGKRDHVFSRYNGGRLDGASPSEIRRILVIAGASRSGSSFLHGLLSLHPDVISLNGENGVFEKLHGLLDPASASDSDALDGAADISEGIVRAVGEDILRDSGILWVPESGEAFPEENFLADAAQRLILQYCGTDLDPDGLHRVVRKAFESSGGADAFSPASFWPGLIAALAATGTGVRMRHYDSGVGSPGEAEPPFMDYFLEEPPFVVPRPRVFPARGELPSKTLLLKSITNCYRMPLIRRLFPKAEFRIIVLARNPMAGVNGLMDGWLSGGFFSRNLERIAELEIEGYSDPRKPWTRAWWKFDLPPGWLSARALPLPRVCAFQWLSANSHLADGLSRAAEEKFLDVRYESFLEPEKLSAVVRSIWDFAGLKRTSIHDGAALRPVMAVNPPGRWKWREREGALRFLTREPEFRAMAERMGYSLKDWEKWP